MQKLSKKSLKDLFKSLKANAHTLNPVVIIGTNGLTPAVIHEINLALLAHELIKVRISRQSNEEQLAIIDQLKNLDEKIIFIQHIGHVVTLYQEKTKIDKAQTKTKTKSRE